MAYELKNIYKSYNGQPVLHDFSMTIPDTGVTCIMGQSGAGKTSVINMILGFEKPDAGEISGFIGKDISVVFQEDRLLEWYSALKNVTVVMKKSRDNAQEACRLLNRMRLDDTAIRKNIGHLSGGMRRRVALARALAIRFDILLLDEPFMGLDGDTKQVVMSVIHEISLSAAVLLVTHDETEAEYFNASIRFI